MMSEPNSSWARVLKGLYFPHSDFIIADKGSRSSWACGSFLEGRDLIKSAAVWSVGDGKVISPFVDAWIPGNYETRLGTHQVTEAQAQFRLAEWINHDTKAWDEKKVRRALSQEEADIIYAIPIPMFNMQDVLRWPHAREGGVTVRTTYHHLRAQRGVLEIRGE